MPRVNLGQQRDAVHARHLQIGDDDVDREVVEVRESLVAAVGEGHLPTFALTAEHAAQRLNGVSCTVRVQADESDKLYGSVGPRDIARALEDQGVEVEPHSIVMEEPLKMLGVYPVKIELFKDVEAEIRVWIIRE